MRWALSLGIFFYPILMFSQINESDFLDRQNFDQGNSFNPIGLENMEDHLSKRQNINGLSKKSPRLLPLEKWNSLLDYLENYGPIIHMNELVQVKELNKEDLELLTKHFYIPEGQNLVENLGSLKRSDLSYLSIRSFFLTQKKKGFNVSPENGGFHGSPLGTRIRFLRRKYGQYSFGLLLDKDPGEGPSKGVLKEFPTDHNSWHIFFQTKGMLKKFILGDFAFSSGEGLIFSPSFYLGKGSEVIYNAKVPESGLRPSLSSSENFGQRGIGLELEKGSINSTVFYSNRKKNSTIIIQDSEIIGFSSLVSSGLHRNQLERQKKANINESILGASLSGEFLRKDLKLSVSAKHFSYSIAQIQNLSNPQQKIKEGTLMGLSLSFFRSGNMTYGEIATSQNGGKAIALGNIFHLDRSWTFGIHFRKYDLSYLNPQGVSFREGNQKNGELGLYFSIKWMPNKKLTIQTFLDQATIQQFNKSFTEPLLTREALLNISYCPEKRMDLRILSTYKESESQLKFEKSRSFRSRAIFQREVQFSFRIRSSLETNYSFEKGTGLGYGLSQELILYRRKGRLSGMIGLFDTQASGKPVYFFEQNVFREYLIPSYSGIGARYLLQIKLNASDLLSLWIRIAHAVFLNRNEIGSSWDEINGNKKTELKVLLKLKLP